MVFVSRPVGDDAGYLTESAGREKREYASFPLMFAFWQVQGVPVSHIPKRAAGIAKSLTGQETRAINATDTGCQEIGVYENNPVRVYVTHTFVEDEDYLRVFEFLEGVDRFFYLNCSKPESVPGSGGIEAIKEELIRQIKECEAMVVLASQYPQNTDLIRFQMDVADANEKPMIVIRSFGGVAETPQELIERVSEHIEWNSREIADALRRQARLEDTSRWDVIDFP